ncbi:hypothetical protein [Planctomicrobium sp. SH527]|uniref:hypothetical protein n=1 Tax=Planctomicrobium sp. SH527 TaxID=3448123 RepID=UPI003F5BF936
MIQGRKLLKLGLAVLALLSLARIGTAADAKQLKESIDRGAIRLKARISEAGGQYRPLMALAMFKSGMPVDTPEIQSVVTGILARCPEAGYVPANDQIYQAAVEATLLSDLGSEKYKTELGRISQYILSHQLSSGGWDYPPPRSRGNQGDTSVTQYACLGLWAAQRAGVEISHEIWEKILVWHVQYQNADGGFAYCPGGRGSIEQSTLNMSVNALGSIHIAMLQLDSGFLPLKSGTKKTEKQVESTRKFGVLEEYEIPQRREQKRTGKISGASIEAAKKAYEFLGAKFAVENQESSFKSYYYYSLERMGALAGVNLVGSHQWFDECADFVISKQTSDGSWKLSENVDLDTAFCVLFLTRSTSKLLKRTDDPFYGLGTLAGGRGLPDDLATARFDGRSVRGKEQPLQPIDQLLMSLRETGELPIDQAQDQIVEQIQLGDRTKLVGQIDTLKRLAISANPEVRKTAIWAIGRSERMDLGVILIKALDDPDLGVIIEARNALCWLSRKPLGFGEPADPLLALPADSSEAQKKDAVAVWHRQLMIRWGKWYLEQRPLDDRGDRFEADLQRRIRDLEAGGANAR